MRSWIIAALWLLSLGLTYHFTHWYSYLAGEAYVTEGLKTIDQETKKE